MTKKFEDSLLAHARAGGIYELLPAIASELRDAADPTVIFKAVASLRESGFDFIATLSALPDDRVQDGLRLLVPAIAVVNGFAEEDLQTVLGFSNRIGRSNWHRLAAQLVPHFKRNSALPRSIVRRLNEPSGKEGSAPRIWAIAFAHALPEDATNFTVSALAESSPSTFLAGLLLRQLDLANPAVRSELLGKQKELVTTLEGALKVGAQDEELWEALCRLAEISEVALDSLITTIPEGPRESRVAISRWLRTASSATGGLLNRSVLELLLPLVLKSITEPDLLREVDALMSTVMYKQSCPPEFEHALDVLFQADINHSQALSHTLSALIENPLRHARVLTKVLLSEELLQSAVMPLISDFNVGRIKVGFDTPLFIAANKKTQVRAVRRLLALVHNGPTLCQFVELFVENTGMQPEGVQIGEELLRYVVMEYPSSALEFTQKKVNAQRKGSASVALYKRYLESATRWNRTLSQLPSLNELRPTEAQLFALHQLQVRTDRDINKVAEEHSVFAQFATKLNVRQGARVASHGPFGQPTVMNMVEHSHSIELPFSERADPFRGLLTRSQLLGSVE